MFLTIRPTTLSGQMNRLLLLSLAKGKGLSGVPVARFYRVTI